jgi:hypothetical protein
MLGKMRNGPGGAEFVHVNSMYSTVSTRRNDTSPEETTEKIVYTPQRFFGREIKRITLRRYWRSIVVIPPVGKCDIIASVLVSHRRNDSHVASTKGTPAAKGQVGRPSWKD